MLQNYDMPITSFHNDSRALLGPTGETSHVKQVGYFLEAKTVFRLSNEDNIISYVDIRKYIWVILGEA